MDPRETTPQERIEKIKELLRKFEVEEHLVDIEGGPRQDLQRDLVHRQQGVELERHLCNLHVADLADLIESLPAERRSLIWERIADSRLGDILLELNDAVAESLAEATPPTRLLKGLESLDADDLVFLQDELPEAVFHAAAARLSEPDLHWLHISQTYDEDAVGHLMEPDIVVARVGETLGSVQERLRQRGDLPDQTDKLFVVDPRGLLCGALFLEDILVHPPEARVGEVMKTQVVRFSPEDEADDAARAFERYDLVSAPVINDRGKPIGRLTVDDVMDYVREASETDALNVAGVVENEDLFGKVWESARNRWLWLSINLLLAFGFSRIIGSFEGTIAKLVALASLMPIVVSLAGNTGNQTAAIVIRSLALDQIHKGNVWHVLRKELSVAALNGLIWGVTVGLFAFVFYQNAGLSMVVGVALALSFLLSALTGVGAPVLLEHFGRDPAMGSSIILTGLIDSMGFFIFLSLATLFLV